MTLLIALWLLLSPASAGELHYAVHNGSLMSVESHGPMVTIRYVQPRPSLWEWGVAPGTLVFSGSWNRRVLVGTAYVFGCGPIPTPKAARPI